MARVELVLLLLFIPEPEPVLALAVRNEDRDRNGNRDVRGSNLEAEGISERYRAVRVLVLMKVV
jgi:hypothetical protein